MRKIYAKRMPKHKFLKKIKKRKQSLIYDNTYIAYMNQYGLLLDDNQFFEIE